MCHHEERQSVVPHQAIMMHLQYFTTVPNMFGHISFAPLLEISLVLRQIPVFVILTLLVVPLRTFCHLLYLFMS